jgi:outer membrane protein OmpU
LRESVDVQWAIVVRSLLDFSGEEDMKKVLLGTTAIVAAGMIAVAPQASAAEKLKASVGGYMEQWFGYTSQDVVAGQDLDGLDQQQDSEIFFQGSTALDNGLTVGINVQLEANTNGDQIDESYMFLKGSFGEINIGSENSAQYKMHYAPSDYGISMNSGDQSNWVSAAGVGGTAGTFRGAFGSTYVEAGRVNDANRLTYYSPRIEGFQLGLSYVPNSGEDTNALVDRNTALADGYAIGANFKRDMGGFTVGVSGGFGTISDGDGDDPSSTNVGVKISSGGLSAGFSYAESENDSKGGDMTGFNAGVAYSSGPMGVSLAYFGSERDGNGSAVNAASMNTTHLSAKYALGPGVTAAGTLGYNSYKADDTTGTDNEGSYMVVGLKVSF